MAYSLQLSLIVPVVHEFSVNRIDRSYNGIGCVECLDLTNRGWLPDAYDNVLDAVSTAYSANSEIPPRAG